MNLCISSPCTASPFASSCRFHLLRERRCLQLDKRSSCTRKRKKKNSVVAVSVTELLHGDRETVVALLLQIVDPWAPNVAGGINLNSQSLASQLFAASLFPYLGFLYHITRSNSCPKLTLFGFYFLLVFVAATIPAGIYAKLNYGTSLANVDWLHGSAESLLTLTNLFIVLGLRKALREKEEPSISEKEQNEGI
ncbi:hypothetical protein KP509_37G063300 [Ceratopteris richardii]|uniref:Uncharacterized protein n=1 Tax=Ceratopteris richardii TaxID=49495 RepID=A0A8T2Q9C0_CERRI|nr:hypothetical protein KP509_37G063300 [Ceratopteris richardii]